MSVRKVKGGFRVETNVGGYSFGHTYIGYNRVQAIALHKTMERIARKHGCSWIDKPIFNDYN